MAASESDNGDRGGNTNQAWMATNTYKHEHFYFLILPQTFSLFPIFHSFDYFHLTILSAIFRNIILFATSCFASKTVIARSVVSLGLHL